MRVWFHPMIAIVLGGCGPKDVIPSAPYHPANAHAAVGQPAPASSPEAPHHEHEGHDDSSTVLTGEKVALDRAKPVFDQFCAKCHAPSGEKAGNQALDHFNMATYPFGGYHATEMGAAIRKVLGVDGGIAKMPRDNPGSVKGDDLATIVEWSKAFDRSHAAGLHHHGDSPHHGEHHGDPP